MIVGKHFFSNNINYQKGKVDRLRLSGNGSERTSLSIRRESCG